MIDGLSWNKQKQPSPINCVPKDPKACLSRFKSAHLPSRGGWCPPCLPLELHVSTALCMRAIDGYLSVMADDVALRDFSIIAFWQWASNGWYWTTDLIHISGAHVSCLLGKRVPNKWPLFDKFTDPYPILSIAHTGAYSDIPSVDFRRTYMLQILSFFHCFSIVIGSVISEWD